MKTIFLFLYLFCVNQVASASAELGWDLSYESAKKSSHMGANEWMQHWPESTDHRQIHEKMLQYNGSPIEASVLIEIPDSHVGEPMVTWIIITNTEANACSFHPKIEEKCVSMNLAKATNYVQALLEMKPLENIDNPKRIFSDSDIHMNYRGFLSVYWKGQRLQRPIAIVERFQGADPIEVERFGDDFGRLDKAMSKVMLSDEEYQANMVKIRSELVQLKFIDAANNGNLNILSNILNSANDRAALDDKSLETAMERSTGASRRDAVDLLLKHGVKFNRYSTDLTMAVRSGDASMVEYLIEKGAYVNPVPDPEVNPHAYTSPLYEAVSKRDIAMVKLLLAKGADVNLYVYNKFIVNVAAENRDLKMLDLLLSKGASEQNYIARAQKGSCIFATFPNMFEHIVSKTKLSSVERKDVESVTARLIEAGFDINAKNCGCRTAYRFAEINKNLIGENKEPLGDWLKALLLHFGAQPDVTRRCSAI